MVDQRRKWKVEYIEDGINKKRLNGEREEMRRKCIFATLHARGSRVGREQNNEQMVDAQGGKKERTSEKWVLE